MLRPISATPIRKATSDDPHLPIRLSVPSVLHPSVHSVLISFGSPCRLERAAIT